MATFPMKVLLAVDGSGDATLALQTAVDMVDRTNSELHVVHVGLISPFVQPDVMSPSQYENLKSGAQERLDVEVEKIAAAGGEVTQAHLRMGRRADEEIIKLAEDLEVEMIVVGSRGYGTLRRAFLGSDSDSIVRLAPCPVLIVRPQKHRASAEQ